MKNYVVPYHGGHRLFDLSLPHVLPGKPLTVYGEGTQTRSFQYVSDLINGIITVMGGEHVGPFNIGNPGEFTMIELVRGRFGRASRVKIPFGGVSRLKPVILLVNGSFVLSYKL